MEIVILSTNLHSPCRVEKVSADFNTHPKVLHWSVDIEDRDNVMRIEAENDFAELDAIQMIQEKGFIGRELEW